MKNSMQKAVGRKQAFTLIETMVAVTILTLAVAGPLVTASRAIVAAQIARSQLTANYLAQEGIEYVRAMRDREYLATRVSTTAWNNFIAGIEPYCLTPKSCTLDPVSRPMGYGIGSSIETYLDNAPLYLTNSGYTQQNLSGSVQTVFTRTIQVLHISDSDERIISKVSWSFHGTLYSVTVTNHLTSWQ